MFWALLKMSGLSCPQCGASNLFKKGGGQQLAVKYGLDFLGAVPLDPATVVAGDRGTPVVLLEEDSPAKIALREIAANVAAAAERSLEAASSIHS